MTNSRIVFAILGLILVVASVTMFQFPQVLPTIRLVELSPTLGTAKTSRTYQKVTAGPSFFHNISVDVKYPTRIYQNETLNISAFVNQTSSNYDLSDVSSGLISADPVDSLLWDINFSLNGAAFTIDPKDPRSIKASTGLPLDVKWTVLPKLTGCHSLLLDVSRIKPSDETFHPTVLSKSFVNGNEVIPISVENPNTGAFTVTPVNILELPVEVVTKWGISQRSADVITAVLIFIGFILNLPFFIKMMSWYRKRT